MRLKNSEGIDSKFSLDVEKLKDLKKNILDSHNISGDVFYGATKNEKPYLKFRRSIYFIKNLPKGHILEKQDVRRIRPGYGLDPKYFDTIIGKKLIKNVENAEPVTWKCFKEEN